MRQWFPLTDYDFYAYITAGMLLIAAADYSFTGGALVYRTDWKIIDAAFWLAISYLAGHILAGPSAAFFEHLVVRRWMHAPATIQLGFKRRNLFERLLAALFGIREYSALPVLLQAKIVGAAAKSLKVSVQDIKDGDAVFHVAFPIARTSADTATRLDQFRNLYGMSRNMAFVALVAVVMLIVAWLRQGNVNAAWGAAGAALLSLGMFGRFLKFYSCFAVEVLRTYASKVE
jgi:hypothetical protein